MIDFPHKRRVCYCLLLMAQNNPEAKALAMMVNHSFEQVNVLTIVLSAFFATIIGRQPQFKDELIRAIEGGVTTDEEVARLRQKAREFIESIPAWVN
jgi:hypothetical protein